MADPQSLLKQAVALHKAGNAAEAQTLYMRILDTTPDQPDALHLLGLLYHQAGNHKEAEQLITRALTTSPDNAIYHGNLARVRQAQNNLSGALESYDKVLSLGASSPDALMNRALVLKAMGRLTEALESAAQAVAQKPDKAMFWFHHGVILQGLMHFADAISSYDKAIALKPNYFECYNNRGNALHAFKQFDAALKSYEQALAINPNCAEVYNNRGNVLQEAKQFDAALASYDAAIAAKPDYMDAHNNRAFILIKLKRYAEAIATLNHVIEIAPHYDFAKGYLLHTKMLCCDWAGAPELLASIETDLRAGKRVAEPFGHQGVSASPADLKQCAEIFNAARFPAWTAPLPPPAPRHPTKIRIGYLSGEFRNQATSVLMTELFERHDKDKFEIYAFDNGWDDRSVLRQRMQRAFTKIIDISRAGDVEAAALVRQHGIDILLNLNGYFGDQRQGVFALKPAPVQANYLGFPGTIGAPYIDYIIADSVVIPPDERQYYTEKVVTLPNSYQVNDRQRQVSERVFTRAELNLPEEGVVFCCFNNNYKITPSTFDGWMRILNRVPGSVLWLVEDNVTAAANLRKEAGRRGIDPARVIFAERIPLPEHLARHRAADLFLDTLPYNAHTTASDALWAGLPLLTCMGTTFPGRVGASLLYALEVPELVTASQEEYENRAVHFAQHPGELRAIRDKIADKRLHASLFNSTLFAAHMEDAYIQIAQRQQQGLPPDHLTIPPRSRIS